jgi:hypothetical protein
MDQRSTQSGGGDKSAFNLDVNLNVPPNRLNEITQGLKEFTVIDDQGRIWSSATDHKYVDRMFNDAQRKLQTAQASVSG